MEDFFKFLATISTLISFVLAYAFKVSKLETKIEILTLRNELLEKINSNESNFKKIESDLLLKFQEMLVQWEFTETSLNDIKKSISLLFKKFEESKK